MKSQGAKNGYNEKPKDVKRIALRLLESTGEKISVPVKKFLLEMSMGIKQFETKLGIRKKEPNTEESFQAK